MAPIALNELFTFILAILAILLGIAMNARSATLRASNIPPAVLGGLVFACAFAALHWAFGLEFEFAGGIRAALLLVFFVGLGLAAKFSGLKRGGVQVAGLCAVIALMIGAQNGVGVALAKAFGMAPSLGLFVGSIPLLGGHGTAAAWAQAPEAANLTGAFELGIAAATLGLVAGGLVAGPVATALARMARKTSVPTDAPPPEAPTVPARPPEGHCAPPRGAANAVSVGAVQPGGEPGAGIADILSSDRWLRALLLIAAALAIGQGLQWIAAKMSVTVPAFLTAMFGGVILTNLADLVRRPVDFQLADLISTVSLRLFLAMAMLSLKLWVLLAFVGLLSAMLVAQIAVVVLVACLLVFPLMGRDPQAAVAAGGFIGFALGAMPVGLSTMHRLCESLGPAPRAFLVITLAASLFADAANAIGIETMFAVLK